jgi:hypothetical protein
MRAFFQTLRARENVESAEDISTLFNRHHESRSGRNRFFG